VEQGGWIADWFGGVSRRLRGGGPEWHGKK